MNWTCPTYDAPEPLVEVEPLLTEDDAPVEDDPLVVDRLLVVDVFDVPEVEVETDVAVEVSPLVEELASEADEVIELVVDAVLALALVPVPLLEESPEAL